MCARQGSIAAQLYLDGSAQSLGEVRIAQRCRQSTRTRLLPTRKLAVQGLVGRRELESRTNRLKAECSTS